MIDTLMINGVDVLSTYHMKADNTAARVKPSRDVETYHISGRNGDVVIDKGGFNNVTLEYSCVIYENFTQNFNDLISFLYNTDGYVKIVDPSDPDHYRMGMLIDEVVPDKADDDKGTFTLPLFCKPQRFALSGAEWQKIADPQVVASITNNSARPWDEAVYRFVTTADMTNGAVLMYASHKWSNPTLGSFLYVPTGLTLPAGTYYYDLRYGTMKSNTGKDYTDYAEMMLYADWDVPFVIPSGKKVYFETGTSIQTAQVTLSIMTNEWEV